VYLKQKLKNYQRRGMECKAKPTNP